MKAIILAGGQGTRLRPVTYEIPKPLLPVKKQPILNHLLELFSRHGISDVGILASAEHKQDFERWQKTWHGELPSQISMFYEESPRGTFGGLETLQGWLGHEPFILSNGDELKDFDLSALSQFHAKHGGAASIALVEVPKPQEYGVPVMEGDRITEFLEKPENPHSNSVSSGLYLLDPKVFKYAPFENGHVMIEKDVFPRLAKEGLLYGFKTSSGRWYDCGTLERWEQAMKEW